MHAKFKLEPRVVFNPFALVRVRPERVEPKYMHMPCTLGIRATDNRHTLSHTPTHTHSHTVSGQKYVAPDT